MKKIFTVLVAVVCYTNIWAHDFVVDGIYYKYLTGDSVGVTYRGSSYNSYSNEYSGSVTIPENVTYCGKTYCVTSIGESAFSKCSGLTSITIPNSVTSIGNYAFRFCSGLTYPIYNSHCFAYIPSSYQGEYSIPNGITQIVGGAFNICSGLTSITIPNSVTSIGVGAFNRCSGLTSITIPESITSIGGNAFTGCSGLTSVTWNAKECSDFTNSAFSGINSQITSFILGDNVEYIPDGLCSDMKNLTSPVYNAHCFAHMPTSFEGAYCIPDGIKQIAGSAFAWCSGLTSITIPNSVTSIGKMAFYGCSGLTSIVIPNSVMSIGNSAFNECWSLTSITIPNSVTSIGNWAFRGCSGLTSIVVEESNTVYDSRENCNALIETASNTLLTGCMNTTIPNSVTSIGWYSFDGCRGLSSITIPNSVISIGENAFFECGGMTSIAVEEGNTVYDSRDNCNAIIETTSNTMILGCQNTTIPNTVTSIGAGALQFCFGLTSITIPNSVTSIGNYAFGQCFYLTSIVLPNSVITIGESAFADCFDLTSVTIPNSVTSIGSSAFRNCYDLTEIICNAVTPPELGYGVFNGLTPSDILLYVPTESVSHYKSTPVWQEFDIQGKDPVMSDLENIDIQYPISDIRKEIRNGQLIIIHDGVEYNVLGLREN